MNRVDFEAAVSKLLGVGPSMGDGTYTEYKTNDVSVCILDTQVDLYSDCGGIFELSTSKGYQAAYDAVVSENIEAITQNTEARRLLGEYVRTFDFKSPTDIVFRNVNLEPVVHVLLEGTNVLLLELSVIGGTVYEEVPDGDDRYYSSDAPFTAEDYPEGVIICEMVTHEIEGREYRLPLLDVARLKNTPSRGARIREIYVTVTPDQVLPGYAFYERLFSREKRHFIEIYLDN